MPVRDAAREDLDAWCAMRAALWPDADVAELRAEAEGYFDGERTLVAALFVHVDRAQRALGMIELSLRSYAEGCRSSPVPYVEAWYVAADARGRGVGRALMEAAEQWARAQGYDEIASDAPIDNAHSAHAHSALGFQETERTIHFRKTLQRK
jgi:aminoglycoside 6'-N-acetyltransferase I